MRNLQVFLLLLCLWMSRTPVMAQQDSLKENKIDSLLQKRTGLLGTLAQQLLADSLPANTQLLRADIPFLPYRDKVIRSISFDALPFGVVIGDTTKLVNNWLTRSANGLHAATRESTVRNYLFFREHDRISPVLLGENERFLRDLPFLQDAMILMRSIKNNPDSIDVLVVTKDVLSIGGSIAIRSSGSQFRLQEDNFMGLGDQVAIETLYDRDRRMNLGFGMEYLKRNIAGSFINGSAGYVNFQPSFSSREREERVAYLRLVKPLVNPFMKFTYAFQAEWHSTANMFNADSVYQHNFQYGYKMMDAWAGWNSGVQDIYAANAYARPRFLVSARMLNRIFSSKPLQFKDQYFYAYADTRAVLASLSFFQLNFYKTSYVYGFGRKEDIPQGTDAGITAGWVQKDGRSRPYLGLSFEQYNVTKKHTYLDYALKLSSSFYQSRAEDITLLATMDWMFPLKEWSRKWKQRSFVSASFARIFSPLLDEPLMLESRYGLPGFRHDYAGGDWRATLRGESVFYSPWNVLYFKFAPFVFGSTTWFHQLPLWGGGDRLYTALGGGIRTRNESLVFGTIELKGSYFPRKDAYNNGYLVELSTNLRFKFIQNFIRRPEFVQAN